MYNSLWNISMQMYISPLEAQAPKCLKLKIVLSKNEPQDSYMGKKKRLHYF